MHGMAAPLKEKSMQIMWTSFYNEDETYYEEKTFPLYDTVVKFSIKSAKHSETTLSFAFPDNEWQNYRVKGDIDYAKKIAENAAREFENIPVDFIDIDLCLRKTFALRKVNDRTIFSYLMRYITNKLKYFSGKANETLNKLKPSDDKNYGRTQQTNQRRIP